MKLRMGGWRVQPAPAAALSELFEGADTELRVSRTGGEGNELKEAEGEESEESVGSGTTGAEAWAEPDPADAEGARSTASGGSMS